MTPRSLVVALAASAAVLAGTLASTTVSAAASAGGVPAVRVTDDLVVTGVEWEQTRSADRFTLQTRCSVAVTFTDATPAEGDRGYEVVDSALDPSTGTVRDTSFLPTPEGFDSLVRDGDTFTARHGWACGALGYPRGKHRFTVVETEGGLDGVPVERSETSRPYVLADVRRPASARFTGDRALDDGATGFRAATAYPIVWNGKWAANAAYETLVTARDYDQPGRVTPVVVLREKSSRPPSRITVPRRFIGMDVTVEVLAMVEGRRSAWFAPRSWSDISVGYPVTWVESYASLRARPKVGDVTKLGRVIFTDAGRRAAPAVSYRWFVESRDRRSVSRVPGARGRSFTPPASMAGRFLEARVSLTKPGQPTRTETVRLGQVRR